MCPWLHCQRSPCSMRCNARSVFVSAFDISSKKRWVLSDPMTVSARCSGIRKGRGSALCSSAVVISNSSVNSCATGLVLGPSFIVIKPVYVPLYRYTGNGFISMDNPDNQQFSAIFRDISSLLELQGDDPYRIRAYRRAAQTLMSLSEPLRTIARRGALETLPGIGKTLSREIQELLETGRLRYYEHLITTVPEGLLPLLRLPSLSTEQVRLLWRTHDISSMTQLAQAFQAERLPFDVPTLAALGQAIAAWEREQSRMLLGVALPRAEILCERLAGLPLVEQVSLAGSLRRGAAMVGDINIVMASPDPPRLVHICNQQPEIRQILTTESTSTVVVTSEGLRVSLVTVLPPQFASALHYYTGSAAHLTALRRLARYRGLDLTPYGALQLESGQYLSVAAEEDIYTLL